MHCIFSDGRFSNKALQVAKSTKHAICHSFVTSGQVMWMLMNVVYLSSTTRILGIGNHPVVYSIPHSLCIVGAL